MLRPNFFSVFTSVAGLGTAFCLGLEHGIVKDVTTIVGGTLSTWGGNSLFELLRNRAVKKEEMLNHHLQKALKEAHVWALTQLAKEYQKDRVCDPAELAEFNAYLIGIKKLGEAEWMAEVGPALSREDVFNYVEGKQPNIRQLITDRMRFALGPGADAYEMPEYYTFLLEHLPGKMAYAFREKIKHGGEAKNALDLLYFESLREGVNKLLDGQADLKQGQTEQQQLLIELKKLHGQKQKGKSNWQPSNDPYAHAMTSALERLDDGLLARLDELKVAVGAQTAKIDRTHAAVREVGSQLIAETQATRRSVARFLWITATLVFLLYIGLNSIAPKPFACTVAVRALLANPNLPLTTGRVTLRYGAKVEVLELVKGEVIFRDIPPNFASNQVKLRVEAPGFVPLDTTLVLANNFVDLTLRHDDSLGKLYGVVIHNGLPVSGVQINVQDLQAITDSSGRFVLHIPASQQRTKQRVRATKAGFQLWDYESPVLPEEIQILLVKQAQ